MPMLLNEGNIMFYVIIAQVGLLLLFWDVWASVKKMCMAISVWQSIWFMSHSDVCSPMCLCVSDKWQIFI